MAGWNETSTNIVWYFFSFRALFVLYEEEQLLDEVEQNIVIWQWRADRLFAEAEGWGK